MSLITALDATNICSRWSGALSDPANWVAGESAPAPVVVDAVDRPQPPAFSWWSMARNPQAVVISGLISLSLARDSVLRLAH